MDLLNIDSRLEAIEKALTSTKTVFTPQEAARYMGIAMSTLYKMTSAGILPFSKPNGKLIFFSKAALDEYLLSNSSSSDTERDIHASTFITTKKE